MDAPTQDPVRGMQVTMMLAEHASVAEGKLTLVGAGWNVCGPNGMCSIGMLFFVPWHLTNQNHTFRLELIDMDGNGVPIQEADEPMVIEGQFEVGRPPGVPKGATFPFPVPLNLGALGLPPYQQCEWRLMVDGETREDWRLMFSTKPPVQGQQRRAA
jgi:hypothetical protein